MNTIYHKFSDFSNESKIFEGDKKKMEDIIGIEILIINFKIADSKQHPGSQYITIQFEINNIKYIVFTGSCILAKQFKKYKNEIPFYTTIRKISNYYTLT